MNTRSTMAHLPLIGVNTFLAEQDTGATDLRHAAPLIRSTDEEKDAIRSTTCTVFSSVTRQRCGSCAWQQLQKTVAAAGGNVFAELMEAVKVLLARADFTCALSGRRPVSSQRVSC